eukprot:ANDGO_06564.mRNA.1 hypothetical protein CAOG_07337
MHNAFSDTVARFVYLNPAQWTPLVFRHHCEEALVVWKMRMSQILMSSESDDDEKMKQATECIHSFAFHESAIQFMCSIGSDALVAFLHPHHHRVFATMLEQHAASVVLSYDLCLVLFPILERFLGDLLRTLRRGSGPYPRLLRDMLLDNDLAGLLGPELIVLLRAFMGHPAAVNLRNVLWHGFCSENGVPEMYGSLTVLCFLLVARQCEKLGRVTIRELRVVPQILDSHFSTSLADPMFRQSCAAYLRSASPVQWNGMRILEVEECNRLCDMLHAADDRGTKKPSDVSFLLSLFEQVLRRVFVPLHNLDSSLLVAQSNSLYLTLEDLLGVALQENTNVLVAKCGFSWASLCGDIFAYEDGVRLRDLVGHGECAADAVPRTLQFAVIWLLIHVMKTVSSPSTPVCHKHASIPPYSTRFHPVAVAEDRVKDCLVLVDAFSSKVSMFTNSVSMRDVYASAAGHKNLVYRDGTAAFGEIAEAEEWSVYLEARRNVLTAGLDRLQSFGTPLLDPSVEGLRRQSSKTWIRLATICRYACVELSSALRWIMDRFDGLVNLFTERKARTAHRRSICVYCSSAQLLCMSLRLVLQCLRTCSIMDSIDAESVENQVLRPVQQLRSLLDSVGIGGCWRTLIDPSSRFFLNAHNIR